MDPCTERKKIARRRWQILAQVLKGTSCSDLQNEGVSVRRFQSFGLLATQSLNDERPSQSDKGTWYQYSCRDLQGFSMKIKHLDGTVSVERLNGFNNTGNVCVWPSEEVMTYYCMQHVQDFKDKRVCELGGGMTCLAGVALAKYSEALHVELTDGNEESVQNLQQIIDENDFSETTVGSRLLRWGPEESLDEDMISSFEVVICADCLFFDDGREDLAKVVFNLLKPGGQALLFAPSRNNTFYKFLEVAKNLFEDVSDDKMYDKTVYNMHLQMLAQAGDTYDESLHFPMLMKLKKPSPVSSRETTPESR